jgi:hypothetical protein
MGSDTPLAVAIAGRSWACRIGRDSGWDRQDSNSDAASPPPEGKAASHYARLPPAQRMSVILRVSTKLPA